MEFDKSRVLRIVKAALEEDLGSGDITTNVIIPKLSSVKAGIIANEECVICGINIAEWVLQSLDYSVRFRCTVSDGDEVPSGKEIAFLEGHARAILTAERTMLNFLSFLSGIATETKKYVDKVRHYNVKILDTRKTFPLLRYLEKYAVRVGGGHNHRMHLDEMVMVKDNHIRVQGAGCRVQGLKAKIQKDVKIEVEVENIRQFEKAIKEKPHIIMLDNMGLEDVKRAVQIRGDLHEVMIEVSGGITLDNIEDYAKTGIDAISIGALTDSVRAIDFSLNII